MLDDTFAFRIEDLATGQTAREVPLAGIPGGPSLIATDPAGGWVVTYTPDVSPAWGTASQHLAIVHPDGTVTRFGPASPPAQAITGLAVSPDGARLALAYFTTAGSAPSRIVVMALPGHSGATQQWAVTGDAINEFASLSWAPDGRHVSYMAGLQTGAGIGSDPITLDTATSGPAPTVPQWPHRDSCSTLGLGWLGTSGRFAVIDDCLSASSDAYHEVDPATGASVAPPIPLPERGCMADLHPSADGDRVLLSRCGRVYLVADGGVTALSVHITDAAW